MATPNMSLDLPVVSSTPGPTWATKVNVALEDIDAHDHSTGNGVKITPAGINITADLEFNEFKATELDGVTFVSRGSALADSASIFFQDDELWARDGLGNLVQITVDGRVNGQIVGDYGLAGVDAEIRYTDSTKLFTLSSDTASGDPGGLAHLRFRDLQLTGKITLESTNVVTVSASPYTVLTDDYILLVDTSGARSITLPAASAGRRVLKIKDKTGQAETFNITLNRTAGGNIDGLAANRVLAAAWGTWTIVSDGTNWFIVS